LIQYFKKARTTQIELLGDKVIPINEDETILVGSLNTNIPHIYACGGNGKFSFLNSFNLFPNT